MSSTAVARRTMPAVSSAVSSAGSSGSSTNAGQDRRTPARHSASVVGLREGSSGVRTSTMRFLSSSSVEAPKSRASGS